MAKMPKVEKKAEKASAEEKTAVVKNRRIKKRHGRLYAKAIFTDYKLDGTSAKQDSWFYVGKKCVYVYKAKNKTCVPGKPKSVKSKVRASN
ncbi:60S ribosomal protein L35a-like [Harmonia axyridis]|uniref:60S ribosomal protein L35a-like n=1 Tax=Harmonia axyridis TaxID=115357 RepID=UPI001E278712|nr:60S ribosomal protein L35a-like [Harmonia axyridis]